MLMSHVHFKERPEDSLISTKNCDKTTEEMRSATSKLNCLNSDLGDSPLNLTSKADRLAELPTLTTIHYGSDNKTGDDKMDTNVVGTGKDTNIGLKSMEICEGSRDSGFSEKNSNTNGNVHGIVPHDNMNDNRQQLADGPIIKKIKQIKMEETPLHLTGLSLSGSGVQLFVKIDDHLEKVTPQKPTITRVSKPGKPRKTTTKSKRTRDTNDIGCGDLICEQNTATTHMQHRFVKSSFKKEGQGSQVRDTSNERLKEMDAKEDQADKRSKFRYHMETAEQPPGNTYRIVNTHSKPNESSRAQQQDKATTQRQQSYFPYGCNQNFQSKSSELTHNVISGPTWNVENGRIDVIKSQDSIPTTSRRETAPDNYDDSPVDYRRGPFPEQFESKDLPLKRRHNSPIWRRDRSTSPYHSKRHRPHRRITPEHDISSDNDEDEGDDDNDEYYEDNGNNLVKEEAYKKNKGKKKQKKLQIRNVAARKIKQSRSEEDVTADCSRRNPKRNDSELSHGEQSSFGPQFETNLLRSHSLDAETLIKFTEYTQALRKDLKQKYRDLSKLLRSFEDAVQERNNNQTDTEETGPQQDGRCRVM